MLPGEITFTVLPYW